MTASLFGGAGSGLFLLHPDGAAVGIRDAGAGDSFLMLLPESSTVDLPGWFCYGTAANSLDQVIELGTITIALLKRAAELHLSVDRVESGWQWGWQWQRPRLSGRR